MSRIISLRSFLCFILLWPCLILNVFYKFLCGLHRKYALGGVSLHPNWIPSVSIASAENQIHFHLHLMTGMITLTFFFFNHSIKNCNIFNCLPVFTDNWDFRKGSYSYYLGDPLYFEVSAIILHHFPLRVYVDHCVATPTPDVDAPVRYDFIDHSG